MGRCLRHFWRAPTLVSNTHVGGWCCRRVFVGSEKNPQGLSRVAIKKLLIETDSQVGMGELYCV